MLNNLFGGSLDSLKGQFLGNAIDQIAQQYNMPQSVSDGLKSMVNNLGLDDLSQLNTAFSHIKDGNVTEAMPIFSNLIKQFPKEGILYYFRGLMNQQSNNVAAAKQDLDQARQYQSDLPDFSHLSQMFKK